MWKKVIVEVILVFGVILAIMGVPTEAKNTMYTKKAIDTECDCDLDKCLAKYRDLKAKYLISDAQLKEIHDSYFAEKEITYPRTTPLASFWFTRLMILAGYFLLIGIISAIISSNSCNYWYYILPLTEASIFLLTSKRRYKNWKFKKAAEIETKVVQSLPKTLEHLNNYFQR